MDPRRLLTFRTVAHERSFSKAAAALSLSQPSVSHQIAQLETEAGVRLLERGRGGVHLTPAGAVLLEHADQLAWRLDLARDQVADLAAQRRRDVRIGCFPTALAGFLPSALTRLAADDVRFRLGEVTPSTLVPRLLSGAFDVALSYQDATAERVEIDGARRIDLLHDTFLIGLAPEHRLAGDAGPLDLGALAGEDWIVPSLEGFLLEACRVRGFEPHIVAVTDDPLTTRGLIARGLGVGWVPNLLVDDYAGVAVRPLATPLRGRDVFALLPPGEAHPLAHTVIAALHETAPRFGRPATAR